MKSRLRCYITKSQKNWDTFVFFLTCDYNVQLLRTKKLPACSLAIILLPRGCIVIATAMTPDVSQIYSTLAYGLYLIHRAALINKSGDSNYRKGKAGYKKGYNKHVRFRSFLIVADYVIVEGSPLMTTATDRKGFEGYSKLLSSHTDPYLVIGVGREYAKIIQNGIQNTVSINI